MTAAVLLLALLGGWEAYARLSGIDEFVLPAPSAVAAALYEDRSLLWSNFTVTAGEIGLGMLLAIVLGLACSVAIHFSAPLRRALYPLLVGSQTIPIVLIAPLLVAWWGFGLLPKLAIVALVFPDLHLFDFADEIVAGAVIPLSLFLQTLGLGCFYIVIYLLLAIAVFNGREL